MSELKPCPFCGGEAYIEEESDAKSCIYNVARCEECGVEVIVYVDMTKTFEWNRQRVIEEWNKRPNPWHTGTPTEEGLYVIAYRFGNKIEHEVREMYYSPMYGMTFGIKKDIVAWQKLDPYEETKK